MELVGSVNKIMKHPKKIHFTRSTIAKNFNSRKNSVTIKSNRFHRSHSCRNSLTLNKNKSQEEVNTFINNNGTESKPFLLNYTPNSLGKFLKYNKRNSQVNFINNQGADSEPLEKTILGDFTR